MERTTTNLTIYFANANIPVSKLDHTHGDHLRWVQDFAGPLSSTNLVYTNYSTVPPTYVTHTFNIALVTSTDLDSDNDGTVNANDSTPIYTAETVNFSAVPTKGSKVLISWHGLARSTNHLEYCPYLAPANLPAWLTLTNIILGPANTNVFLTDPISPGGRRYYRLRIDMPSH